MIADPRIDPVLLARAVRDGWAVELTDVVFIPSLDMRAASYEARGPAGRWFLKVRLGSGATSLDAAPLAVARGLVDRGIGNVVGPLATRRGALAERIDDERSCELYPFVDGRPANRAGMTAGQWRTFGRTLRAVHDSHLDPRIVERIPVERFDLPFEVSVRAALAAAEAGTSTTPSRRRLAEILNERRPRIEAMLARASDLGRGLSVRRSERVLCHADIHLANILVNHDGAVHLVDWDGPIRAPRERDLLFVIGSRVAGTVAPADEDAFFEGYGRVDIDPEALIYYRYERVLGDIGESGRRVFEQSDLSELDRAREVDLAEDQFAPGNVLETAEEVVLPWDR